MEYRPCRIGACASCVAALAFGRHVLAEGAHGLARDRLAADRESVFELRAGIGLDEKCQERTQFNKMAMSSGAGLSANTLTQIKFGLTRDW